MLSIFSRQGDICIILSAYLSGKATVSNDGATIMKLLDIVHPAAKTLVDIAKSQDAEVTDQLCVCSYDPSLATL